MTYDVSEQEATLHTLTEMLRLVLADGGRKRAAGTKPLWKVDEHRPSFQRHIERWERGEEVDPDSGAHPLVHAACRGLMIAWQETHRGFDC